MIEKQQQLTFNKGITNVPSDAICSDGSLEESVGLVADNGELRVIQKPATFMTGLGSSQKVIYVHVLGDSERYIIKNGNAISWGTNNSGQYSSVASLLTVSGTSNITSIGKTLIISDNNGIHCFLWKTGSYATINYPFPEIGIDVKLVQPPIPLYVQSSGRADGIVVHDGMTIEDPGIFKVASGSREAYNDLVVGLYNRNLNEIAAKKCFAKPFFVRMAIELYDGSYTYITNPVLLLPTLTKNTCGGFSGHAENSSFDGSLVLKTIYASLYIKQTTDYRAYKDIIKDVVLFATKGVNIYDTTIDQPLQLLGSTSGIVVGDAISEDGEYPISEYRTFNNLFGPDPLQFSTYDCLTKRSTSDIKKDLEGDTIFYKICSLGLAPIDSFVDIKTLATDYTFENITVQEQLRDDYYSRCNLVPEMMYAYNGRLNLAGVSRGVFEGFHFFMPFDSNSSYWYNFYVKIKLDTESVWVSHSYYTRQKQGIYFFYPDSRAVHVTIYRGNSCVCDAELKESESLNGAYYFKEYPSSSTDEETVSVSSEGFHVGTDHTNNSATEFLPNYILQSDAYNPFMFMPEGYFQVGTGKIVGMSSITQALSEGQFGQYPLLVFSESGIWSLSVGSTGYYTSVHPMSREVPLLDNPCITQTDGAVFFASKKGLMVIVGSQVKCVSEQLSGKNNGYNIAEEEFPTYLSGSIIAYDYRDSLLWIINNSSGHEEYNWIYSIKNGTFSKFLGTRAFNNVVSFYPDSLLQRTDGLFSLMQRDNINDDNSTYTATLITRPMKLENALALKSIMEVRHIMDMEGSVSLKIYASNNLKHAANTWVQLTSLRGTPWKYYKFEYTFTGLKATDRYAGTLVVTQERRTDKLR